MHYCISHKFSVSIEPQTQNSPASVCSYKLSLSTCTGAYVYTQLLIAVQAIEWYVAAWNEQKQSTFANCWTKSGIMPSNNSSEAQSDSSMPETDIAERTVELDDLISGLGFGTDALSASEFIVFPWEEDVDEDLCLDDLVDIARVNSCCTLPITLPIVHVCCQLCR